MRQDLRLWLTLTLILLFLKEGLLTISIVVVEKSLDLLLVSFIRLINLSKKGLVRLLDIVGAKVLEGYLI